MTPAEIAATDGPADDVISRGDVDEEETPWEGDPPTAPPAPTPANPTGLQRRCMIYCPDLPVEDGSDPAVTSPPPPPAPEVADDAGARPDVVDVAPEAADDVVAEPDEPEDGPRDASYDAADGDAPFPM